MNATPQAPGATAERAVPPQPGSRTPGQQAWRRFRRNVGAVVSAWFLAGVLFFVCLWPAISPYPSDAVSDAQFAPPSRQHWFGTDVHGRDLLTRVACGARVSLLAGAVGTAVSLVIGVLWGAVAGYVGGRCDNLMMRFVDVLYALPSIVFVIVLLTALNGVLDQLQAHGMSGGTAKAAQSLALFGGLGAVSWLTMARIVRGQVLSLRTRSFVDASRALGAGHAHILWRHILPNVAGLVVVYAALTVPAVVLYESFLSYLGLGIQPPEASLGSLLAEGASQINPLRVYWWIVVFPASLLATTLLALNFLGDGLRDAFDPKA